jgi:preprotein translocase subunit SecF
LKIPNPYASKHYYLLGVIPVLLILVSLLIIPSIPKGIELRGGTLITVQSPTPIDSTALQNALSKYSPSVSVQQISSPVGYGLQVQLENPSNLDTAESLITSISSLDNQLTSLQTEAANSGPDPALIQQEDGITSQITSQASQVLTLVGSSQTLPTDPHAAAILAENAFSTAKDNANTQEEAVITKMSPNASVSVQEVGSTLSAYFLSTAEQIVLYAFILSAIAIFIVFRSVGPSIAVIFGAAADIIITAGVMGVLGIPLTLASIATLLMLIGFSLDTDVMLTIRVLQRKEGKPEDRALNALKTGALMNATTIGAFGALFIIGTWLQVPTYQEIGAVAVIGGFVDFIATWCFDASMVLHFAKQAEQKSAA